MHHAKRKGFVSDGQVGSEVLDDGGYIVCNFNKNGEVIAIAFSPSPPTPTSSPFKSTMLMQVAVVSPGRTGLL